jgi:cell division protein FtsW (lipid II flippase)
MRIEFQLTLADWIEWKRANLSKQRLAFLILAETSLIPLIVICALTIVLAWLRYVPGWLPIVILSLIALGQIYLSGLSRFRRRHLKEEWLNESGDQTITVETNPDGFDYFSNRVSYKPTWNEVASVYQTKRLLMFCDSDTSDTYVLLIPKHAFASKQQLNEFLDLAYQKTVADRQATQPAVSA